MKAFCGSTHVYQLDCEKCETHKVVKRTYDWWGTFFESLGGMSGGKFYWEGLGLQN